MRSRKHNSIALACVLYLLFAPISSLACGPFTLNAVFVFTAHPGYPLERFAAGDIGVVQPSYARSYLYVAYRYLQGSAFTPAEQRALSELWKERLNYGWEMGEEEWIKSWLAARKKVTGLAEPADIRVYRNREKPNQYETFLNCQKDAFENAAATLNARLIKFGSESDTIKQWVGAQDQVFSNCGEGQNIPSAATDQDALVRADREYQIAAANFYATNFDEAIRQFDAIAKDKNSPWQAFAPYLAVRALVRKASLSSAENGIEPLSRAEARLEQILRDQDRSGIHAAASRLRDLVRLRLHPAERLNELAKKLTVTRENLTLKQDLWDYTVLLDKFLETSPAEKANFEKTARADDLTDWLDTIQLSSADALNHSVAKWHATRSTAWLIAALSQLSGTEARTSDFTAEALKVPADSAAFPSARYHAVRLLIESGKANEARSLLDDLLKNYRKRFDASAQNLLLGQRTFLASSLDDFLAAAARYPAAFSWDEDEREIPAEPSEDSPELKAKLGKQFFDGDATTVLNRHLPLSLLKEAATSSALPVHLRRDVAQAAWLRAVLLGDLKTADELVPTLKQLVPELTTSLNAFVSISEPAAKRFSAIYAWLKFPGMEPVVDEGLGREAALNARDVYRDNWWCSAALTDAQPNSDEEDSPHSFSSNFVQPPIFLSAQQKATAAKEYAALTALGAGPNYIAQQAIDWANTNPKDPRAPEALHLAVTATRYGCTDKNTGRWSKAAFDLLHRKYPNSTWAQKTKYWFKD